VASDAQAIASEHRNDQDRSKKGSGNIERDPAIRMTARQARAYAGALIDLDTTLPVISQQFEPVCEIDKQAVEKDTESRERLYSRHNSDWQIEPIGAPLIKR
jgi:hypothetical protein